MIDFTPKLDWLSLMKKLHARLETYQKMADNGVLTQEDDTQWWGLRLLRSAYENGDRTPRLYEQIQSRLSIFG